MHREPPNGGTGDQGRIIKRVRQACTACRRKKLRCSGERPTCALCRRSAKECDYSQQIAGPSVREAEKPDFPIHLQSRVTTLEAQLEALTSLVQRRDDQESPLHASTLPVESIPLAQSRRNGTVEMPDISTGAFPYLQPSKIEILMDEYFRFCQNKPYSIFHEESFKERWRKGLIPIYLQNIVLATALPHSQVTLLQVGRSEMEDTCIETSWREISRRQYGVKELDLQLAQGTFLHSVLDLNRGEAHSASVKAGITVRMCQMLRLMLDPDEQFSTTEQEERRRLFWSTYLLERFAMCGNPWLLYAIADEDCYVQLPTDELSFQRGLRRTQPSLLELQRQKNIVSTEYLSPLAILVLTTSILGRCMKFACHSSHGQTADMLFAQLGSIEMALLVFEDNKWLSGPLQAPVERHGNGAHATANPEEPDYYVLATALYQLCYCMLYHPLLLMDKFASKGRILLRNILHRTCLSCRENAVALSGALKYARENNSLIQDCKTPGSTCAI